MYLGNAEYRCYSFRAYRTVAVQLFTTLFKLQKAYQTTHGSYLGFYQYGAHWTPGQPHQCTVANVTRLGFDLPDCERARYGYTSTPSGWGPYTSLALHAISDKNADG